MPGDVRRVLMTADAVGGVWRYSLDLCAGLRERGIHATLAVMGPPMRDEQRRDAAARQIEVVEAPFRLEWMNDPWTDVDDAGRWLLDVAAQCRPDVVHLNGYCHATLPWAVPAVVVAHSCVRTWWKAVHGDDAPECWDVYSSRVASGLRSAALVVAPTRALLQAVVAEYGPVEHAAVIPNGSSACGRPPIPLAAKQPFVFAAGRLWDEAKNVASVSAIAPSISWPVFLAGDLAGPSRGLVPGDAACYLGQLSEAEMVSWYTRAAIYALPVRYEPFGLSIVEAAAAGCALVLGDIRTMRENWDGAALFVPADNRRALATAIQTLIDDEPRRLERARRAQERAAFFTVGRMADGYRAAYRRVHTSAVAA